MSLRGCSDSPGDASATYITRTTMKGFDRIATPKVNIRTDRDQEPMDEAFRKHLVKIWGSLVTDAAANELLSATDTAQDLATIDEAHASRRLLSRTLKLDDYMNGVLERMIVGKGSLCSLIQFSPNLREVFTSNVASMKEDADADAAAVAAMKRLLPGHTVIGINPEPVNAGGGGLNCISNNMPAAV